MTLPYVFGNYFIPSLSTKSRSSWLPTGFFHMTISQAHKTQHFQSLFPQCTPCSVFLAQGVEHCHLKSPDLEDGHLPFLQPLIQSIHSLTLNMFKEVVFQPLEPRSV